MKFSELDRWYDELPAEQKKGVQELYRKAHAKAPGARLVPLEHGPRMVNQLAAAKARFFECKDPFCLVRIGDSELGLLGGGFLPDTAPRDMKWYHFRGGFNRTTFALRKIFIEALRGSELVGVQQNWKPITESTATLLGMLDLPLPMPNAVEVHLPYQLLIDGSLFGWLAGKRVLLIGWLAPKLAEAWKRPDFKQAYASWGPLDKVTIVDAIPTRSRQEGGAAKDYEDILRRIEKTQFDVALLSCGVTAKPLAWKIRQSGKTAIDIGFVFNSLLGDGEREKRPVLREAKWPAQVWWRK